MTTPEIIYCIAVSFTVAGIFSVVCALLAIQAERSARKLHRRQAKMRIDNLRAFSRGINLDIKL